MQKPLQITNDIRLAATRAVREIGVALQHLDQADEDFERNAGIELELAEALDCLNNATEITEDIADHIETNLSRMAYNQGGIRRNEAKVF